MSVVDKIMLFVLMLAHLVVDSVKRVSHSVSVLCLSVKNKTLSMLIYLCEYVSKVLYNLSLTLKKHVKVQK